ncbi:hypothetical protein [Mesorhizobium sp. B2-6-4]|uniref:hypothetical protein n=1 Tax=Mesorhizobium sp. B2-6-4 TaxID=2589913 RepID=UPI00112658A6|nr:hypothetical protein [Mesorhizobium sp. B2-6-4]TPJ54856.1 hypothetical protein FJ426_07730 [Mesorhizobium sp. B2-6-4]
MPSDVRRSIINQDVLPKNFPTNRHAGAFWEALGRTVATFGFLEETIAKAIFAFTGTREIPADKIEAEFEKWLSTLQKALSDPLGGLIDVYGKAVRQHPDATLSNLQDLLDDLRKAAELRNVLCHGSWRVPDAVGRSIPHYVDRKNRVFETPIDVAYLDQVRQHVVELACAVINSVSHMGWQFPGSQSLGKQIF